MLKLLVVISVIWINWTLSSRTYERVYNPRKWDNCPIGMPMMLNLSFPSMNYVNMKYSGSINVTAEIKGEIELVMEGNRCTLDMKTCEKNNNLNVGGICQKFHDKNAFYSSLFDNIKPRLKCPIKPGIYTIEEGVLDLSLISLLPLDGYIYVCAFKLAYGEKGSRTKKVAMCLNTETKIFKAHKKS